MTAVDTSATFSVFTPGCLDVLSIGKGDLRLMVGDSDDDRERAKTIIEEMLRAGYSIYVETDRGPTKIKKFNPRRMTYVISEAPTGLTLSTPPQREALPAPPPMKALPRTTEREIPVAGSRATAVGRTAGG